MIPFLLSFLFFFGPIIFLCVLVYGWKQKHDQAVRTANYNAQAWAQAEATAHDAELESAEMRGELKVLNKGYDDMRRLAKDAIKVAEVKTDLPERLRMADDDRILDDDLIG